MKSCRDVRARIFAVVEGSLPIEETLAIEEHARGCAACAAEMRRAMRLHDVFAQMPAPPVERVDVERNLAAIRAAIERDGARRAVARPAWRWIAAAALVATGAAAGWWLLGRDGSGSKDTLVETHPVPSQGSETTVGPLNPLEVDTAPIAEAMRPEESGLNATKSIESGAASTEPVAVDPVPVDLVKLEAARSTVRAALIAATPALEAQDIDSFLARFDADTRELTREKWPLIRLVEPLVVDDDLPLSVSAMRWLGRRGDSLSVRRIAMALDEPARKQAAAAALVDLGPIGRDALATALLDDDLREGVLEGAARRDPAWLVALLTKAARAGPRPLDVRIVIAEVSKRRLSPATSWLEDVARERTARGDVEVADAASRALASLGSLESLRALLRLREHAPEGALDGSLAQFLSASGESATALARELVASKRGKDLRALNEALLVAPGPSIVPALIVLAASSELGTTERRTCILLAGEQGADEHLAALADLFRRLERRDRSLKAAALVAIHARGGRAAVVDAMSELPRATRERALAVLDGVDTMLRPETTLLQLARELEPKLAPLQL